MLAALEGVGDVAVPWTAIPVRSPDCAKRGPGVLAMRYY